MGIMIQVSYRSGSAYLFGLLAASLIACTAASSDKEPLNTTPAGNSQGQGASTGDDDDGSLNAKTGNNSAFGTSSSSSGGTTSGGTTSSSGGTPDAGTTSSSGTVTTATYCDGDLAVGDLVITELMIASKAGAGDTGEWVELTSTRNCTLKLGGVTITSPRGTMTTDTASVDATLELAPGGTIVVADVPNPALGPRVYSWSSSDVLKNDGDTVNVMLGTTVIDTITYGSTTAYTAGTSIEFPAGCSAGLRTDVSNWMSSTTVFGGTFDGTPNAANTDVSCLSN